MFFCVNFCSDGFFFVVFVVAVVVVVVCGGGGGGAAVFLCFVAVFCIVVYVSSRCTMTRKDISAIERTY